MNSLDPRFGVLKYEKQQYWWQNSNPAPAAVKHCSSNFLHMGLVFFLLGCEMSKCCAENNLIFTPILLHHVRKFS